MRFDISWCDLVAGIWFCLVPFRRERALTQAEEAWSPDENFVITLSVRSAFDLVLRCLKLERGSEVLFSALTVPDMPTIAKLHGLVPIPVDTDAKGNFCVDSLKRSISGRSRVLVVAHLFGGTIPLDQVAEICLRHNILLIEDCAQNFQVVGESGHVASDIAMFSFGPIKTATALGGGILRTRDSHLLAALRSELQNDPIQLRSGFLSRLWRFAGLKALTGQWTAKMLKKFVNWIGLDYEKLVTHSAGNFSRHKLLRQIRRRPCIPLLRLLRKRWLNYDFARVKRRIRWGVAMDRELAIHRATDHSYWVYPIVSSCLRKLVSNLQQAGFDATQNSRLAIVEHVDDRMAENAYNLWRHTVFLPWYPELTLPAIGEMADAIGKSEIRFNVQTENSRVEWMAGRVKLP